MGLLSMACVVGKLTYMSRSLAKKGANRCRSKHGNKMRVYRCGVCNKWHLAHEVRR